MGSLEAAVLEVLWASTMPLKPGDVLERLTIEPTVTYSTVLTILRRLWKKSLVTRVKTGKAFSYSPVSSREEHVANTMTAAFAAAADPSAALAHFVRSLSEEQTSALRRELRGR